MIADPDIVRTVLTIMWLLAEPLRLAAGYYGNLQENVSGCSVGLARMAVCVHAQYLTCGWRRAVMATCRRRERVQCGLRMHAACIHLLAAPQVPWLVVFSALTLAPQTAVCYYMMLAQWVSGLGYQRCMQQQAAPFAGAKFEDSNVHALTPTFTRTLLHDTVPDAL